MIASSSIADRTVSRFRSTRPLIVPTWTRQTTRSSDHCDPQSGSVHVRIVADRSAIVAYVNDVALSTRGYDLTGGVWGLVSAGGLARLHI